MAIVKLSATERRRLSVFFTCLSLAVIAWIFTTLSDPLYYKVKKVLAFKNAPQRRAFHSLQPDTVDVTIQGTGWQMLFSKMNNDNKPVTIDLRSLETRSYVVIDSNQLKHINAGKDPANRIASVDPDTLYFDFSNRLVKKVPVQLTLAVAYQKQFAVSGNITVKPAYVTISGPVERLKEINVWKTDSLKLSNINESINTRVSLQPTNEGNLSVYPRSVQAIIPVDEFTEKTMDIPVKLINNNYANVKVFPQKVKVTFTTSLSRYPDMDEDLFEAIADLNLWRDKGYSSLPVKLIRFPPFCKVVKVEPANIDFIIKK